MKILFISESLNFWQPIGLMLISAIAKQKGHKTYSALLPKDNIENKIIEIKPDVIAYSSCTNEYKDYLKLNRKIKKQFPKVFTIMGGSHPTFFPEVVNKGNLDAVCIGEGEIAFIKLLDKLQKKESLSNINNIIIKGEKIKDLNPLIQDLDPLPLPDRELFYGKDKIEDVQVMNILASRGCPFQCTYCFNSSFNKMYPGQKYIRKRSVDNVIKEAKQLKEQFGIKFIKFADDMFMMKKEDSWVKEFCEKFPQEVGLPFLIYTRYEVLTEDNTKMLKEAGCIALDMSVESSNQRIRKEILKRNMTNEQIINGANFARNAGLNILGYTMLGIPTSTLEDDIDAVNFVIKAKINVPEFAIFQPYPKTELAKYCEDHKLIEKKEEAGDIYTLSKLNCFSEKEKVIQKNIQLLAPFAVHHPWLKRFVMNYLIYKSTKEWFNKVNAIDKFFTYNSKIYNVQDSFKEKIQIFMKTLKLEKHKNKSS